MRQQLNYKGPSMTSVKTVALMLVKWVSLDTLLNLCESQFPQESNADNMGRIAKAIVHTCTGVAG